MWQKTFIQLPWRDDQIQVCLCWYLPFFFHSRYWLRIYNSSYELFSSPTREYHDWFS